MTAEGFLLFVTYSVSWSKGTNSYRCCLYDTDSISFYLFAEKGTHILMFLHKVNVTTQQFLQVASGGGMVIKLRWHDSKEVNIASFVMLISGNRAKNAQGRDAETLLQLLSMTPDNINIFAL